MDRNFKLRFTLSIIMILLIQLFAPVYSTIITNHNNYPSEINKNDNKNTVFNNFSEMIDNFLSTPKVQAKSSVPKIERVRSVTYGLNTVGEYRIDGELAYCFEHHRPPAYTGQAYHPIQPYDNAKVQRALYYGWGGDGNIFKPHEEDLGIVVTGLIVSRAYNPSDPVTGTSLPKYYDLWDKVENGEVPDHKVSLSKSNLTVSVSGNKQISAETKFNAHKDNEIKFKVPSDVTLIINNKIKQKGGTATINGGDTFYFEAPLDYNKTFESGELTGKFKAYQPIITKSVSGNSQDLGRLDVFIDPTAKVSFKVPFQRQESKITVEHRDIYNNNRLVNPDESFNRLIGSTYEFKPKSKITTNNGNNVYLPSSTAAKKGTVPSSGKTITFFYDLTRTITVNHKDIRDDKLITSSKDTKRRGDKYSYSHKTNLKKGDYTYRPLSTDSQSGTVNGSNITLNFYYDVPLIKTGVKKIQVYTAPADEGLPVIVDLIKENNYPYSISDMNSAKISVNLYKGSKKIKGKEYTAKSLPTQIEFTVPPSELEKDELDLYTVKLEGFNKNDFDIASNRLQISTDGYTSAERVLEVHSNDQNKIDFEGVIKTERTVGEEMIVYNESFSIPIEPIKKMKTGYGFYMPIELSYTNDLGNKVIDPTFNMIVPESIVDKSFIHYDIKNNKATVPLELTKNVSSDDKTVINQTFELQHVNVEKITGHLFTDKQVNENDVRIKHDIISGDRKFYLPIWGYTGEYDLYVHTVQPIGINLMDVKINHTLDIVAHMYLHMDSETKEKDAIHFEPINQDNPFPNGVPDSWTSHEVELLKNWLKN